MLAFLAMLGCFAGTTWRRSGEWRGENGEFSVQCFSVPNPQSLIPNPPSDAWLHVLLGGVAGFLLSVPVGLLGAAPPGAAPVLLGLPLAAGAAMLMLGWIREGRLARLLPAAGVAVLLVNLLAAGGIGFPSVAGTLWLLLALGLEGEPPRTIRALGAWLVLGVAVALAAACYGTAYSPVLGCQAKLRLAEREPARAVEHLEAAATADPWAAEPWRQLAAIEFENWWQRPGQEGFGRFERACGKALELAPNSAPTWLAAGDWRLRAFSKTDGLGEKVVGDAIEAAVAAYRHAVQLYPNNAVYRAKLAEACRAGGDEPEFRREAEAALELDSATPHSDKKLPADVRERLIHDLQKSGY
jgi:tetratricopeptide (TPR) repeat protein